MLPEVGATELLVIATIALIVVGPKDLPLMLRKLGQFVGRMRAMASEFRTSLDDMARQSELDELRKEVQAMRSGAYIDPLRKAVGEVADPEVGQVFTDIHAGLTGRETVQLAEAPEAQPAPAPKPRKPRVRKKPGASA